MERLHTLLGNSGWALTGSSALWYHNMHAGFTPRKPHDVNIAVSKNARQYVISRLAANGWTQIKNGPVHSKFIKGNTELDVLTAGSSLAPNLNARTVTRIPGAPPIVNIQSLFNRKKAIRTNSNFHLEKTPNRVKTNVNLKRLRAHGARTKSPAARRKRNANRNGTIRPMRLNF